MAGLVAETVALEGEETIHIADVAEVVFPTTINTDALLPGVNEVQDLLHNRSREWRRALRKASDELIEELLGRNLQVEGVAALGDKGFEQGECK